MSKRGFFLVIDGPDGAGKTTQVSRVAGYIRERNHTVETYREPGDTKVGDQIRSVLLNPDLSEMTPETEMFLYMASRSQLVSEQIRPALKKGHVVVLDRYYYSTVAYQGIAGGIGRENVLQAATVATGGLEPDLAIFLDLPASEGFNRLDRERDRMEEKDISYHEKVRNGFRNMAEENERIRLVDATGSPGDVQEQIQEIVRENL